MKTLLSILLGLAISVPAMAVDRVHGKTVKEFKFKAKAKLSKKKAPAVSSARATVKYVYKECYSDIHYS